MSDTKNLPPPFDEKVAAQFIGKYVLVGITYVDSTGRPYRQEQLHGVITAVSKITGFKLDLKGVNEGRTYWLPPNIQSMKFAQPGEYTLRQTKEVISDPDLLWTWIGTENTPPRK